MQDLPGLDGRAALGQAVHRARGSGCLPAGGLTRQRRCGRPGHRDGEVAGQREHGDGLVRSEWQETARTEYVESAIARTLTGDIYRADDRAISSVNRQIFAQQQTLAERIREIRPRAIFVPPGKDAAAG